MGCCVYVHDDRVDIDVDGLDRLMALKGHLTLSMADIVSARVAPVDEPRRDLGWRVAGGYWPGLVATGHFLVRGRPGARPWWLVYRDPEVLVIDTDLDRPCRVVLQHPDRHDLAWLINERVARRD